MQKRAQETRRRILDSAILLFSQKGLNGARIEDIAAAAAVNKQRIYAYFQSKDNLFAAALLNVFENVELFSRTTLQKAEAHPENLTEIILQGFLKVHARNPALWRLLAWANLEGKACVEVLNQVRRKENAALRALFERNVRSGIMRKVPFEIWLFALLALSCFRFSNCLTLSQTLGWDPAGKVFEKSLVSEMDRLFRGGVC